MNLIVIFFAQSQRQTSQSVEFESHKGLKSDMSSQYEFHPCRIISD